MRIHDVKQNTPEWDMLRAGIPTSSCFDKIVTATGKLSKSSRAYKAHLLAERVLRCPISGPKSFWMDRGTEFEAQAVAFYEFHAGVDTERVGFITNDAGTIGASPDRWSGKNRMVEIKVPAAFTHMGYIIARRTIDACEAEIDRLQKLMQPQSTEALKTLQKQYEEALASSLEEEYKVQTAGQLWVCDEKESSDLLSFSPEGLPPVLVLVKRDVGFIETLGQSVTEFSNALETEAARMVADGIIPTD